MSRTNVYLLLPETNPVIQWALSNEEIQTEEEYVRFVRYKTNEIEAIHTENYQGFYDNENVANFFEHFDTLEDLYPSVKTILQRKILDWQNWRAESKQNASKMYEIFGQPIKSHTLPEMAQHKQNEPYDSYVLLNNRALNIGNSPITVTVSEHNKIEIEFVNNTQELKHWFSENRIPQRNFQITDKHPFRNLPPRMWRGRMASYLHCNEEKAQDFLKYAIGEGPDILFAHDNDNSEYIVFYYENNNPQNMYHGYHVPEDSDEIPEHIKRLLQP